VLTVNDTVEGELSVLVDSTYPLGSNELLRVTFEVATNAASGPTTLRFVPGKTSLSDELANEVPMISVEATVTIGNEQTQSIDLSGRVVSPDGRGVGNAKVTIIDSRGRKRTAITSSFGYYSVEQLPTSLKYEIEVRSRRHDFEPRVVTRSETGGSVDFIASK